VVLDIKMDYLYMKQMPKIYTVCVHFYFVSEAGMLTDKRGHENNENLQDITG